MKKIITYIALATVFFACSCSKGNKEENHILVVNNQVVDSNALKIATLPTIDCLPLFIAEERGWFKERGIDVALISYNAQLDIDTALTNGSVDAAMTDLVRAEKMRSKGVKQNYVSSTNLHWKLICNRNARITKMSQLSEKTIGMTRFSGTHFLMTEAFKEVELANAPFSIQLNDLNVRLNMLLNNEIDAAWFPEPYSTKAMNEDNAQLFDTNVKDIMLGVLSVRDDAMKEKGREDLISELGKIYSQACDSINQLGYQAYTDVFQKYMKADTAIVNHMPKQLFVHFGKPSQEKLDVVKSFLNNANN